jgi:hypothetical protein
MDETGFRKSMRRLGKKPHVIDGLVRHVQLFEQDLKAEHHKTLEDATAEDIRAHAGRIDGSARKKRMRAIALYFRFLNRGALATAASAIREKETATSRRVPKLRDFRGVSLADVARLEKMGIATVQDLLGAGSNREDRRKLARQSGVRLSAIVELVKLSDLSRLKGIKSVRTRLYYNAGLDTLDKFAKWKPEDLRQMLIAFVEQTGFDGIPPLLKELRNTIESAKKIARMVKYL